MHSASCEKLFPKNSSGQAGASHNPFLCKKGLQTSEAVTCSDLRVTFKFAVSVREFVQVQNQDSKDFDGLKSHLLPAE